MLVDKLNTSYKYVSKNSKCVKINYSKVDEMISKIENSSINYWLDSNPFGILDMNINDIYDFLLIYHTIGDYCFWGEPKWEIDTINGKLDGSYAIMYLIVNKFKENPDFDISFEKFSDMLKGNVQIPLLEDRYNNLVQMNNVLKKYGRPFSEIIKNIDVDSVLLEFIANNFSYFYDVSKYDGEDIYFYKRAQLLTSDLLHIKEKKENTSVCYSNLVGCADYKIPQVMRCYGMLEFDNQLANKVDEKIELSSGSLEEVEIRACCLEVINYIYEKTGKKYTRMDINDFIWLLGQDKTLMTKPYHRVLTKCY